MCVCVPECFGGHVCGCDPVVDQRLVPHRVQGVLQRLGAEFVRLEETRDERRERERREREGLRWRR